MGFIQKKENAVSLDDCAKVISFIDDNISKFAFNTERKRHMLRFGYDDELPELAISDYRIIDPIKDSLKNIFASAKDAVVPGMTDKDVYLVSFFLSKHAPGGGMRPHMDSQDIDGHNRHLDYTVMTYLNSMGRSGTLSFPIIGKRYSPNAGEMIAFESKDPTNAHAVDEVSQDRYSIAIWFSKDPKHKIDI